MEHLLLVIMSAHDTVTVLGSAGRECPESLGLDFTSNCQNPLHQGTGISSRYRSQGLKVSIFITRENNLVAISDNKSLLRKEGLFTEALENTGFSRGLGYKKQEADMNVLDHCVLTGYAGPALSCVGKAPLAQLESFCFTQVSAYSGN